MKLGQRLQGRMVLVIGAAIVATSLASVALVGGLALNRTEEVLAQTGDSFLRLGVHASNDARGQAYAGSTLLNAGIRVEATIPSQFAPWPWYRPIRERLVISSLQALHPGATARLTTAGGRVVMWVRSPEVMSNRWLGFDVAVNYSSIELRLLEWLGVVGGLILIIAAYLARQISKPLEALAEAAALLGRGVELPPWQPVGSIEVRRLGDELYQAAAAIRRSLRDRDFLFASISHDLRTPLARMRLALDFLHPAVMSEERELINGMSQDIDEMDALVKRFIEQLREGADERPTVVDLCTVVNDVAQAYCSYGQDLRIECRAQRPVELLPLSFHRLLRNLIQNAIDHGEPPIVVEAWTTTSEAILVVRDHGRGLSDKRLAVLRRRAKRETFGFARSNRGLGLRIAERIAESHGGQLKLSNADPGLRVELRWPLRWPRRRN